jgi:microcystin-dependent protein
MSEPFLSEIRMVGFTFAPRGWAFCNGQLLPILQNQTLYSLLGTTYGGDGRTTFALPDLRARTPIHHGTQNGIQVRQGENRGSEYSAQIKTVIDSIIVDRGLETNTSRVNVMQNVGTALTPYIGINFAIALQGVFPNRN